MPKNTTQGKNTKKTTTSKTKTKVNVIENENEDDFDETLTSGIEKFFEKSAADYKSTYGDDINDSYLSDDTSVVDRGEKVKPITRRGKTDATVPSEPQRAEFNPDEERLKEEVGEAIDPTVFDEELAPSDDRREVIPATKMGDNLLSSSRLSKTRTRTNTRTFKMTTHAYLDMGDAERYYPSIEEGLTSEQVTERMQHGYVNVNEKKGGKSYLSIFMSNIFTFFNVLMFAVAIALLVVSAPYSKFIFLIIVFVNISIGIFQEVRSKRAVDKLKIITAPTAIVVRNGERITIPVGEVVLDDIIYYETGKQICADSILVKGEVETNESFITGESVPVKKELSSQLFSGSFVSSGNCYARVDKIGAANYVERLTSYAKRYKKPKSELKSAVTRIVKAVSIIIVPLAALLLVAGAKGGTNDWPTWSENIQQVGGAIIGMIPSGLFLLTSVTLARGVFNLAKKRALVKELYCIEMLARVDVLCLDKTGTITDGTMAVNKVVELKTNAPKVPLKDVIGSMLTATGDNNQTALALADKYGYSQKLSPTSVLPFSSQRKLSAVSFKGIGTYVLGAPEFIMKDVGVRLQTTINEFAASGLRVIMLAHSPAEIKHDKLPISLKPVAVIAIEDHIREDAVEVIKWFKENDVAVRVISGDNPITVSEVAAKVGVENASKFISLEGLSNQEVIEAAKKYTVFGRVSPEQKRILVKAMKANGETVAMTGDGVNDILAMREADCSISIASGAEAARNVSHLVLMDSNFSAMPQVVMEGRRVVNNVQNASPLYLMKTIMSVLLTAISIILAFSGISLKLYFFDTDSLLPLEMCIIGISSYVLAWQPNQDRIKGNFLSTVLKRSFPGGLTLFVAIMSVYFYSRFYLEPTMGTTAETTTIYNTMLVTVAVFVGFMALVKICHPINAYRTVLLIVVLSLSILALTGVVELFLLMHVKPPFGDIVNIFSIGFMNILFASVVILASYFLLSILIAIFTKIKSGGKLLETATE